MSRKVKKNITKSDLDELYEKFVRLTSECEGVIDDFTKVYRKTINVQEQWDALLRNSKAFMQKTLLKISKQHERIDRIMTINSNIEETLCHVLLAIRQNEYLQANVPSSENMDRKVIGSLDPNFTWHKDRKNQINILEE